MNPLDGDVGPLANLLVMEETGRLPAVILGTSSDRIGTDEGRAIYATASKNLEALTGLPVAPYAGASFSTRTENVLGIGGLTVFWSGTLSSQHLWDGRNLHHVLNWRADDGLTVGLVVAEQEGEYFAGVALSWAFGG